MTGNENENILIMAGQFPVMEIMFKSDMKRARQHSKHVCKNCNSSFSCIKH